MSLTETLYACCSTFKATLLKMPSKRLARIAKDRVLAAWEKIGAIPLTRNCLTHPKVRHEAGGVAPAAEMLEALAESHVANQEAGRGIGLNVGCLKPFSLPTPTLHVRLTPLPVSGPSLNTARSTQAASAEDWCRRHQRLAGAHRARAHRRKVPEGGRDQGPRDSGGKSPNGGRGRSRGSSREGGQGPERR